MSVRVTEIKDRLARRAREHRGSAGEERAD